MVFEGDEKSERDLRLYRVWMKASRAVFSNVDADIASYGLRKDHFMILELLYNKGDHPIQKISETLAIPSGSMTYVVDKLEHAGYVSRKPSPTDRRGSLVTLTEKGRALFNEIFPKHVATISRNLSFIDDESKQELIEFLKQIGLGAEALNNEKE